jgi:hypothetical protein
VAVPFITVMYIRSSDTQPTKRESGGGCGALPDKVPAIVLHDDFILWREEGKTHRWQRKTA